MSIPKKNELILLWSVKKFNPIHINSPSNPANKRDFVNSIVACAKLYVPFGNLFVKKRKIKEKEKEGEKVRKKKRKEKKKKKKRKRKKERKKERKIKEGKEKERKR